MEKDPLTPSTNSCKISLQKVSLTTKYFNFMFITVMLLLQCLVFAEDVKSGDNNEKMVPDVKEITAFELTAAMDINSAYVWRGLTVNDGLVVQPWIDLSGVRVGKVPLSFNIWSNYDIGDFGGTLRKNRFSEVDFTLSAELGYGFIMGYSRYMYITGDHSSIPDTGELFIGWSTETDILTPSLTLYYDSDEVKGAFLQGAISRTFTISERNSVNIVCEVGLADDHFADYYSATKEGFYHYNLMAKLSSQITEKIELKVLAGYTNHFDRTVLPAQKTDLYAGLGISYTF